jgi:putative two-component system response regulator
MADPLDFTRKHTVLVVDDTAENLQIMYALLKDHYAVKVANNGELALKIASTLPLPDLVLLDIMMPGIDGYEVCRRLKADPVTADLPVIFLTVKSEVEDEQKGFDAGCVDYISKPVSPPIVLARVRTHIMLKSARDFLKDQAAYLEEEVERRVRARTT